jgi:hypothetical protein
MVLGVVSSLCVASFAIYGFEAHFVGNIEEINSLMPTRLSQRWVKWANLALNYFQGPKKANVPNQTNMAELDLFWGQSGPIPKGGLS